eukprot:CAMPEP_0176498306 /NCGR_PEP_ID=MMETSP0200_2-20121128/12244_1 /TAXON_ID=947934 /ORGANISM="Chaetoceros sp., Strain GSL56" /LENGTH=230 /DNA_ID=CAMNT_0017896491 /DNA_START=125 /DNA_END=814 /DNA_ORIENTATION=-
MEMEQPLLSSAAMLPAITTPQPFGLIIPGHNVITDFIPDCTGTKFTLNLPFPFQQQNQDVSTTLPLSISDLVFFLLPNIPLPPTCGAILYWSALPMDHSGNVVSNIAPGGPTFELLGALTPTEPSAVFRTGWSNHEQLLSFAEQSMSTNRLFSGIMITLGVSIEPLDNIKNLQIDQKGVQDRKNVAKNIATDLFNYLQSFDDVGNAKNGWMTVPTIVFERWFKRFESKLE